MLVFWMLRRCCEWVTYDGGLLVNLAVARAESLPSHRGGVAAVEDIEGVEGNVGLLAVVGAELGAGSESDGVDDVGALATAVADDVDGGAPVDKVLGEGLLGQLESVALDELLEDVGDLGGVLVGQALVALALALVEDGMMIAICRPNGSTSSVQDLVLSGILIYTAEIASQRRARARLLTPTNVGGT